MQTKKFIKAAISYMKSVGVKVVTSDGTAIVADGVNASGYFDCDKPGSPEFGIATGSSDYELTFIHEYSHFLQYQDGYFDNQLDFKDQDDAFKNHLSGKMPTDKNTLELIRSGAQRAKEMEWDCERRVLGLIQKYKLPINESWYIQMANVYVLSHDLMLKYGVWLEDDKAMSAQEDVIKLMPTTLIDIKKPYKKLLAQMEKFYLTSTAAQYKEKNQE